MTCLGGCATGYIGEEYNKDQKPATLYNDVDPTEAKVNGVSSPEVAEESPLKAESSERSDETSPQNSTVENSEAGVQPPSEAASQDSEQLPTTAIGRCNATTSSIEVCSSDEHEAAEAVQPEFSVQKESDESKEIDNAAADEPWEGAKEAEPSSTSHGPSSESPSAARPAIQRRFYLDNPL